MDRKENSKYLRKKPGRFQRPQGGEGSGTNLKPRPGTGTELSNKNWCAPEERQGTCPLKQRYRGKASRQFGRKSTFSGQRGRRGNDFQEEAGRDESGKSVRNSANSIRKKQPGKCRKKLIAGGYSKRKNYAKKNQAIISKEKGRGMKWKGGQEATHEKEGQFVQIASHVFLGQKARGRVGLHFHKQWASE